jgi:ABC-type uncharacterized transport system involved in gliding motility auxiliary subunit
MQKRLGASSLLLLGVGFIAAVILSNALFKGLRLDLTENKLYTLSEGTRNILEDIDEPVSLHFYYSDQATAGVPSLRSYANRVRELLDEFARASGGKLRLNVIDPLPFSEEEDRAAQAGLQGVQLGVTPDPVYLGLVGSNSVGDEEVIGFFQPDREAFLEYDLARLVSTLANPELSVVGLVTGVSMGSQFDPQTQRMQSAWMVYQQAQQLFEVRELGTSFAAIPEDISLLWIVQPKQLSSATQYAIDQFIMRGGKALIFVDPFAAVDAPEQQGMPQGMPPMPQSSDLPTLFQAWGIQYSAEEVAADSELALAINTGMSRRPTRHFGYLGITTRQMNDGDITTAELDTINVAMAGHLALSNESTLEIEPLLSTSESSSALPSARFGFMSDPASLQDGFVPGGEPLTIAARFSGPLKSAFPAGAPASSDGDDDASDTDAAHHLAESSAPANFIVMTDVDFLSDPLWVQVQNFFGQQLATAFAGNGAFALNALENLAGSTDLISVRSRGSSSRPFTRVDQLRTGAEARFRETEQRLQQELAETERRLGELQSARADDGSGSLLLTDEQEAEIDRFIDQRASIRKELRSVQRGLDADIEKLGSILKVINIALVPLLLTLLVLFVLVHRRRRLGA